MAIGIGVIGLGTVGSGVVELLRTRGDRLAEAVGDRLLVARVAARTELEIAPYAALGICTTLDALALVEDPEVRIVVEVAGGYEVPRPWFRRALELGKPVVTANKALLARHGGELFPLAAAHGAEIRWEAAVGGAIPVIRALREAFVASETRGLACIINGTSNYILSRMGRRGLTYAQALAEAQAAGYAESDPTFDVDGTDAAHKVSLLASLCAGRRVDFQSMHVEGISRLTREDVVGARELDCAIRLLGLVNVRGGRVDARVHPCLVPLTHPLANVEGAYNAVFVDGSTTGQAMLYGKGAGRLPTASAVVADIADAAYRLLHRAPALNMSWMGGDPAPLVPLSETRSRFYLRLRMADRPGSLGRIATILGEEGVSVSSLFQHDAVDDGTCPVVLDTHVTGEDALQRALRRIDVLPESGRPATFLRFYEAGIEDS